MRFSLIFLQVGIALLALDQASAKTCSLRPLGPGKDDTDQVLNAISECGHSGSTTLAPGNYNITRKMLWDLKDATVDLYGMLSFSPNISSWLNLDNTYRVVFIQSQSSWFVVTGNKFVIDGHSSGGIQGNGQPWWTYFATHKREDGDGRPISLTLSHAVNGAVSNFKIESPPFWCNAVADSKNIVYTGMTCNSTNTNPELYGTNPVINTDGIDTYRSDSIAMVDWDVTTGDDCIAIKGNSTNILARNIMCRGGNGMAIGSLGQYQQFNDIVENVLLENITTQRLPHAIQPNMMSGLWIKTYTGSVDGVPPTAGGGGGGRVNNVTTRGVYNDNVTSPVFITQKFGRHPKSFIPSKLQLSNLMFDNWIGTSVGPSVVDLECSSAAPCTNIHFEDFAVTPIMGQTPTYKCMNVVNEEGLPGPCMETA